MKSLNQLQAIIQKIPARLHFLGAEKVFIKPAPHKWSPKEELGHLLDSAANNHQRIVRVQMEDKLALPGYQQEKWVKLHGYQEREWNELINLWTVLNQHLLAAAHSVPENAWLNTCTVGDSEPMT
ncbi:MAG TPA: DinB family protein, partial [Terriglobales bacterium]|nr:DinB family protein [Terriglobales bacterium]